MRVVSGAHSFELDLAIQSRRRIQDLAGSERIAGAIEMEGDVHATPPFFRSVPE